MEAEIEKIKKEAIANDIPIIMDDTLNVLKDIILENQPRKILEIGTGTGYSSICFASILKNNVEDVDGLEIDTIEIDEKRANEAIKLIESLGLENTINVIIGDAVEVLPNMDKVYDMVFIDASKSKYPVFLDHALSLTKKGSVIIADNVLYKGYVLGDYNKHKQRTAVTHLRDFLNKLKVNPSLDSKIIEVGDGLAVSYYR